MGRPAWLTEVGNYLLHSGALFATYFNGNAQYPTLKLTDSRVGRRLEELHGQVRLRHLGASTGIASTASAPRRIASTEPHGHRDVARGWTARQSAGWR